MLCAACLVHVHGTDWCRFIAGDFKDGIPEELKLKPKGVKRKPESEEPIDQELAAEDAVGDNFEVECVAQLNVLRG